MYWRGHVGIGLLAYAPIAAVVLDAGEPGVALLGGVLAVAFATLPDADQPLPIPHRGPTHTVAFAVVTGFIAGMLAAATITVGTIVGAGAIAEVPGWTPAFVGTVVTITLLSHVAGDAITPMGIRPFRPLSDAHFTLDLTPAKNPRANYLFLAVGVLALSTSVWLAL